MKDVPAAVKDAPPAAETVSTPAEVKKIGSNKPEHQKPKDCEPWETKSNSDVPLAFFPTMPNVCTDEETVNWKSQTKTARSITAKKQAPAESQDCNPNVNTSSTYLAWFPSGPNVCTDEEPLEWNPPAKLGCQTLQDPFEASTSVSSGTVSPVVPPQDGLLSFDFQSSLLLNPAKRQKVDPAIATSDYLEKHLRDIIANGELSDVSDVESIY